MAKKTKVHFNRSWFMLCALVLTTASPLLADTHLVFPRIIFQQSHWIGIALANPTSTDASVTLTAHNLDGTLFVGTGVTNPVTKSIAKGSQYVGLAFQAFSAPASMTSSATPTRLWMEATSTTDGITGFFLEGHDGPGGIPDYLAGSDLSGYGADLAVPVIANVSPGVTELSIVNPDSSSAANLSIVFLQADGTTVYSTPADKLIAIPPEGGLQGSVSDLFSGVDFTRVAGMRLHSDRPVHCYGSVFRLNEPSLVIIAGQNASLPAQALKFPQLAEGAGYSTLVGIQNLTSSDILVTLTAYNSDGELFSAPTVGTNPATTAIKAGGVLRASMKDLFQFAATGLETGWLKVETNTSSIIGYVEYTVGSTRALVPGQTSTYTRSYFSYQYLGSPYFTGLAILNPTTLTSNVQVYSLDSLGVPIGVTQQMLKPGQKSALVMQQWVPATNNNPKANGGAVLVQSDNPMTATQLWGTQTFTALANISPQQVSNSYDPGGLSQLIVTPPLAVVESGKTKQFNETGSTGVTWSVEGANPALGSISPAGLYQAPATAPAQHDISIEAITTAGDRAAGATIDVVQRETLIGGLTLLTAVAYLQSLQRFFIAEQQVLSSAPALTQSATTTITSISEVSTAGVASSYISIPNDTISKMLPLVSGGSTYILLAGFNTGTIYRLRIDDGSKQLSTVATGLSSPNSMAIDAISGDLLVSDLAGIHTIPRATILMDVSIQSESLARSNGPLLLPGVAPQGIATNPCTGALYYTQADGTLHQYQAGQDSVLTANLNQPGQILVLFRVGFSCTDGLVIAVAEAGDVILIYPGKSLKVPFLGGVANLNDLTFLPDGNPFTRGNEAAMIIGEGWPGPGQSRVTIVRVGGIYRTISPVPPPPISTGGFAVPFQDPVGDTFATSRSAGLLIPDIVSIGSYGLGEQTPFGYVNPPYVEISITFSSPVAPYSLKLPNSIQGSVYLNTGSVGAQVSAPNPYNPYFQTSGIGINFQINLETEKLIDLSTGAQSDVLVRYFGTTVSILLPNTVNLSKTKAIVLVGNTAELTDVSPNSSVIDLTPQK